MKQIENASSTAPVLIFHKIAQDYVLSTALNFNTLIYCLEDVLQLVTVKEESTPITRPTLASILAPTSLTPLLIIIPIPASALAPSLQARHITVLTPVRLKRGPAIKLENVYLYADQALQINSQIITLADVCCTALKISSLMLTIFLYLVFSDALMLMLPLCGR